MLWQGLRHLSHCCNINHRHFCVALRLQIIIQVLLCLLLKIGDETSLANLLVKKHTSQGYFITILNLIGFLEVLCISLYAFKHLCLRRAPRAPVAFIKRLIGSA